MNKGLPEKIIQVIKNRNIEPRPRWRFLVKRWVIWLFAVMATVSGSTAVAVIIFVFVDYDASTRMYLNDSIFVDLVRTVPFIWIALLTLLVGVTQYAVRHTNFGYRHRPLRIVVIVLIISVLFGFLLSFMEVGEQVQDFLIKRVPYYNQLSSSSKNLWLNPKKGLLGGVVTALVSEEEFILTDFKGKEWLIDRGSLDVVDRSVIVPGSIIKLIGTQEADSKFRPVRAFFWR